MPLSNHWCQHRCRDPSARIRERRPRHDSQDRAAEPADRSAVPLGPPLRGGSATADGPTVVAGEGASGARLDGAVSTTRASRPYYVPVANEERVFKAAFRQGMSVALKGPTGCGKTRFLEAMAHDLDRPLITVACHDDLTTADLVGRFLLRGGETEWVDGPLTRAVREGAICYLDEIVEAQQDTTVVLHALADHRRQLPIERLGVTLDAAPGFCLVVSYNPGYQSVLKDLKESTRQRMVAIEFGFPAPDVEEGIVAHEAGVDRDGAARAAVAGPLTDDSTLATGLVEMINVYLDDQPSLNRS